jgi:ABC-type dipeptide/oligopeptide/nickel transport system permease subunit
VQPRGAGFGLAVLVLVTLVALTADLIAPYNPSQIQPVGAILGPGLTNVMVAIGSVFTPGFARLVRGQTLSVRERDFVTAARVTGAGPWRIMGAHIWPNITAPIVVQASLQIAAAIVIEAGLSFLGLGVQPPTPSWGSMLKEGYQYMGQAPWLAFAPGVAMFLTVLAFNLFGDGLRQALDPRASPLFPTDGHSEAQPESAASDSRQSTGSLARLRSG